MVKSILLWGTGVRTRILLRQKAFQGFKILAIIDTNKKDNEFMGYKVIFPYEVNLLDVKPDYIVLTNKFYKEILENLYQYQIDPNIVVITDAVLYEPFKKYYFRLKKDFPAVDNVVKSRIYIETLGNEKDSVDSKTVFHKDFFCNSDYYADYFRYRSAEFAIDEIERRQIPGEIAEVGVFRGTFSAVLNERMPDRNIYLFDTFMGFDKEEAKKEIAKGRCKESFIESHKDTSIERMLANLPHPEKAIVKKGFFPSTVTDEIRKLKFSFVSLDVDFEDSTLEGLRFFYPRLSENGYIFVHDYNTFFLDGIRAAVYAYEREIGKRLSMVPIADRAGTLIITK